jgi:putative sterol carrier protein
MSIAFGTVAVYDEMAKLLNADPVWADKGRSITYTMTFEYTEPVSKAFFIRFEAGTITEVRELASADAEPADFVISGDPQVWRDVFAKRLNPSAAMTRGQLKVKGKLTTLLRHMGAFSYVIDAMTSIELV